MNKKQIVIMIILTLVIAVMEISGMPAVLFVNCRFADVTPYIISLMVNFLIMGFLALIIMKAFGRGWLLGLHRARFSEGIKKYSAAGFAAGILSCAVFCIGLAPFDYKPSIWKVLIEGILYYLSVAFVEEFYLRGLFLNAVDKIAYKKENHTEIAIWVSSIVFGLGHIPEMINQEPLVIFFKVVSTIGMGLYFSTIYKKTNNLWLPIILHAFIDICALPYCFTTFSGYKTISLIGLVIIYTLLSIYSVVLMKQKNC